MATGNGSGLSRQQIVQTSMAVVGGVLVAATVWVGRIIVDAGTQVRLLGHQVAAMSLQLSELRVENARTNETISLLNERLARIEERVGQPPGPRGR